MRFDMLSAKLRILQPVCRELQHLRTGALGRVLHELACSTMSLAPAEHAFCTRSHGGRRLLCYVRQVVFLALYGVFILVHDC